MLGINSQETRVALISSLAFCTFSFYAMTSLGGGKSSSIATFAELVVILFGVVYLFNTKSIFSASRLVSSWVFWIFWVLLMSFINMLWTHGVASILHPVFCPMSFLLFYALASKDIKVERITTVCFSVFIVLFSVWCYSFSYTMSLEYNTEFAGFNLVYWPLCCLPFIFLLNSKKLQFVLLFVLALIVLYCQKRSASIILISVVLMFLINNNISFKKSIITISAIIGVYLLFDHYMGAYMDNILYRMRTIQEDQGSGRVGLWDDVFNKLSENSIIEWIVGRGEGSIRQTGHSNAHNDFLQLLFEYGIVGFVFYLVFIIRTIKKTIQLKRVRSRYFLGYFTCASIILVMGMVSDLFVFYSYFAFICAYMGMAEALSAVEDNNLNS